MARQTRKWNPGDAANTFVRVILSDAGTILGGITEDEWEHTLAYFNWRCAYTGAKLVDGHIERDHAIPMNREHCGIHLYGNVLPVTKEANRQKASKPYYEFVKDQLLLDKIKAFIKHSRYQERIADFGDLQHYCEKQYHTIKELCEENKEYLQRLLPEDVRNHEVKSTHGQEAALSAISREPRAQTLPITLCPQSKEDFKKALLRTKEAFITEMYQDGRKEVHPWHAKKITERSNILHNLRSRPKYRQGIWQEMGITKVHVSIKRPCE